ncbi:hypothetical protein G210_4050 [Candida maltosa Xu316]|uniref:Uncharacterized protein n=1 Tax=Candida maltosa (strain Xu316) TaxID=1245528 RepID=M3J1J2_CANMX|nr:hypothetical protein G210_4050 [Candida maltosa Xu316]
MPRQALTILQFKSTDKRRQGIRRFANHPRKYCFNSGILKWLMECHRENAKQFASVSNAALTFSYTKVVLRSAKCRQLAQWNLGTLVYRFCLHLGEYGCNFQAE